MKFLFVAFLVASLCIVTALGLNTCDAMHAFAGESGATFTLTLPPAESQYYNSPLVLAIFTPTWPVGDLPASMNVTYQAQGISNSAMSNPDGYITISDYVGTSMEISVVRDGSSTAASVPFTFISYFPSAPKCSIRLDNRVEFVAKVPAKLQPSNSPAALFFVAPTTGDHFTITSTGFSSLAYAPQPNFQQGSTTINSGAQVDWNPAQRYVFLSGVPSGDGPTSIDIVIQWESRNPSNQGAYPPPPGFSPGYVPPPTANNLEVLAEDAGIGFGSFLLFCILVSCVYILGRSVYNYRVLGITTYPDFVPHHETFAKINEFINGLASNFSARRPGAPMSGLSRGGYEDVDREELEG